jgi:hypothetical protein
VEAPALPGSALADVAVTSWKNAWAVGSYSGPAPGIILHWDGTAWAQVRVHLPKGGLAAVAATSGSEAWTVGSTSTLTPLAVHWDGIRWSVVPTPVPGRYNALLGVSGVAPDDMWAVGDYTDEQGFIHPLAMHWDGSTWQVVTVPEAPLGNNIFYAVDAVATNDVWAVGIRGAGPFEFQPLIDHWDGTAWSVVQVTAPPGDNDPLYGVSGTSSNDAWAVGFYEEGDAVLPLVEHWNGSTWRRVATRALPEVDELSDVKALSPTDAWAAGIRIVGGYARPLSLHWNGSRWKPVSIPGRGLTSSLNRLDASSANNLWAVGTYLPPGTASYPLIEHSKGCT